MNSEILDTRGDICPVPVLKTIKKLVSMHSGDVLTLMCDHPPAIRSIPMELKKRGIDFELTKKGAEFEIKMTVP